MFFIYISIKVSVKKKKKNFHLRGSRHFCAKLQVLVWLKLNSNPLEAHKKKQTQNNINYEARFFLEGLSLSNPLLIFPSG